MKREGVFFLILLGSTAMIGAQFVYPLIECEDILYSMNHVHVFVEWWCSA